MTKIICQIRDLKLKSKDQEILKSINKIIESITLIRKLIRVKYTELAKSKSFAESLAKDLMNK